MSTSNAKAHKKAIIDKLILSGYTKNYIRRALKVHERNYGIDYNADFIAEIIRRLQKKDKNKQRQTQHSKSRSENFDHSRSYSPRKQQQKHASSVQRKKPYHNAKSDIDKYETYEQDEDDEHKRTALVHHSHEQLQHQDDDDDEEEEEEQHTEPEEEEETSFKAGDIVEWNQHKARIVQLVGKGRSAELQYPVYDDSNIADYQDYHVQRVIVELHTIKRVLPKTTTTTTTTSARSHSHSQTQSDQNVKQYAAPRSSEASTSNASTSKEEVYQREEEAAVRARNKRGPATAAIAADDEEEEEDEEEEDEDDYVEEYKHEFPGELLKKPPTVSHTATSGNPKSTTKSPHHAHAHGGLSVNHAGMIAHPIPANMNGGGGGGHLRTSKSLNEHDMDATVSDYLPVHHLHNNHAHQQPTSPNHRRSKSSMNYSERQSLQNSHAYHAHLNGGGYYPQQAQAHHANGNSHHYYGVGATSERTASESELLRVQRWIQILRESSFHINNNKHGGGSSSSTRAVTADERAWHNDVLVVCDEIKAYMLSTPNWDLLIRYDMLHTVTLLLSNILSPHHVDLWCKVSSLALNILSILVDYYLKLDVMNALKQQMQAQLGARGGSQKKKKSKKQQSRTLKHYYDDKAHSFEMVIKSILDVFAYYDVLLTYDVGLSSVLNTCCSILGKLVFENHGNIECVLSFGGIDLILQLMVRCYRYEHRSKRSSDGHGPDSGKLYNTVIIACLNLLCLLCYNSNTHRQFICANGGCVAILDLLQYFMSLHYHHKNKIQNGGDKQKVKPKKKKKKKTSSTLGKRSTKNNSKRSQQQQQNEDRDVDNDDVDDLNGDAAGGGAGGDDDHDRVPHGILSHSKATSKLSRSKSTTRHSNNTGSDDEFYIYDGNANNKQGVSNEPMTEEMLMVTSILRTLGNFTFVAENIEQLLQHDMLALLYRLVTEIDAGTDSNMLVILMQILSDIGQTSASLSQRSSISSDILNIEVESWLLASILKLGLKNRHCILLQQCMLDQLGTLVHISPEKNARLLIQHQGEIQIFDRIKELNYPEQMVILSLRLVKSMCIHKDISSHLVKQSNVFNFLTHIMKHWRLKRSHDSSLRIQCCCEVIRSLTNIEKFSKYANKCHVISGLIKILMLNDDAAAATEDNNNNHERIEPMVFIEILKTFISICSDEENSLKLAKHGTKSILSGIDIYSSASSSTSHVQARHRSTRQQRQQQQRANTGTNNGNMQSSHSSLTASSATGNTTTNYSESQTNNNTSNNKFVQDLIKHIAALFCGVSKYASVCAFLFNYNALEIAYNILAIYSQNVFICDQFICFLTNMLAAKREVYHVLETKLHTQELINKILYLHSNSDSLISTCHRYHQCIEVWLRNHNQAASPLPVANGLGHGNDNGIGKPEMGSPSLSHQSQPARMKRFPMFNNEAVDNPYRVGEQIEFQERENMQLQWVAATVVDAENNWIIIRFLNTSHDEQDSSFRNDRKIHVLKHKERLRLLYAARDGRRHPQPQQQQQHQSPRRTRTRERDRDRTLREYASDSEEEFKAFAVQQQPPMTPTHAAKQQRKLKRLHQKQAKQQRQYEMNVFLDEIQRFNWNLIIVSDADGRNSLYKMIKKEVEQYKAQHPDYFRQFGLNTADIHFDYMTLIALAELYNVRIRVFSLHMMQAAAATSAAQVPAVSVAFECGDYQQTLHLPMVYLAYLHGSHFHLIQDPGSVHIHQRPLIDYLKHSHFNAINSPNSVSLIRQFRFQKFYEKLFDYFDEEESGKLTGQQLFEFFVSSELSTEVLRTIWDDSVGDNCPTMDLHQFMVAMSLILAKQLYIEHENGGKYGRIDTIRSHKPGTKHKVRKISTQIPQEKQRRHHAHQDENQRNSENDATTYNIIHAGLPNMKYPINPYDTYNHYFYSNAMHVSPYQHRYSMTQQRAHATSAAGPGVQSYYHEMQPRHAQQQQQPQPPQQQQQAQFYDEDEINENLYYQNNSSSQPTVHHHGNMYMNMRQSTDQTNTTLNHNNGNNNSNQASRVNGGGVNKQREFLRFYHSVNFGGQQEVYYDKIAEFEYNDIEKMMELDRDILTEEFEMTTEHAALFMSKINKFKRKYLQFKKWLVEQLKLRRYFVKFVNEGILTFDILLTRFHSYHDLVPLIGDKNISDAKLIFKKLPKSAREN